MTTHTNRLAELQERLRTFVSERNWGQYHSPKNLTMALTGEVGELVEHFQWLTEDQSCNLSEAELRPIREEIADVQIYLMLLSDRLGVDLMRTVDEKIGINEAKYPVDKARGKSKKYNDL